MPAGVVASPAAVPETMPSGASRRKIALDKKSMAGGARVRLGARRLAVGSPVLQALVWASHAKRKAYFLNSAAPTGNSLARRRVSAPTLASGRTPGIAGVARTVGRRPRRGRRRRGTLAPRVAQPICESPLSRPLIIPRQMTSLRMTGS